MLLAGLTASAQQLRRGDCTPPSEAMGTRAAVHRLPAINKSWNPYTTYRQLVILMSFSDCDFLAEDPQATYDSIFNVRGYNQGAGPGCVADYFREQSGGLCNLQFDVYGPIKLSSQACPYTNPTDNTRNYGREQLAAATTEFFRQNAEIDYKQYDWDGDGYVNQIIYVYAGYSGNQGGDSNGHIWPNTSTFNSTMTCPDGTRVYNYTCSGELWLNNCLFGIGTICHEYSHSLGLPDIYPTSSAVSLYSVVDEWDLMDGGNYSNFGWCPPNYSPLEKILLGWLTPNELTEPMPITDMKSISDGGPVYIVHHTENEYLLLENRQWRGWDSALPGNGLVIYHVDYSADRWRSNTVNASNPLCYQLVPADNRNYDDWETVMGSSYPYRNSNRMNNRYMSTAAYPYVEDGVVVNQELTDSSVPSALMNKANGEGSLYLSLPITDIQQSEDGLVSFRFRSDILDGIREVEISERKPVYYDLQGRRISQPRSGLYIRNGKKVIVH